MACPEASRNHLQEFVLYETQCKFYVIGRNKTRTIWRVLKIDRLEPSELNIHEDPTMYSQVECEELLKRIDEGNKSSGGLKFVTHCYGIVGFIKFLEPYYMILITKRRPIGVICGHTIYAIARSQIVAIPNPSVQSNIANSKIENRYKKLFCSVDLRKDFFFSYSYHIMQSLQKNACDGQKEQIYETMFAWNEFLTRGIRDQLKDTVWTVALVYGFFKQAKIAVSGKNFWLTLLARRSRHYAGTRYLKRGVNEEGRVANDVETEQIVFEDIPVENPLYISSVVQNRGSIPLFWSQETSKLNLKPDIVLIKKDKDYEATRLHFQDLLDRYGNPIVILNLIKSEEKRPRESILRSEFANAIHIINKSLPGENQLKFLHWDLHKHSRSKAIKVLTMLGKIAESVLSMTGLFFCEVTLDLPLETAMSSANPSTSDVMSCSYNNQHDNVEKSLKKLDEHVSRDGSPEDELVGSDSTAQEIAEVKISSSEICSMKPLEFQRGVLRTNCIDCLDRTNVAQYAFGLAALGHQLHALKLINVPKIELDSPLADDLMKFYEIMGDTLALQYGGSAAHNKIFSERRGQCRAATQSQEFFRTLQRYYNNAYMDVEKQAAINLFLGLHQPQLDNQTTWSLGLDQHGTIGSGVPPFINRNRGSFLRRSLSDGTILCQSNTPLLSCTDDHEEHLASGFKSIKHDIGHLKLLSDSSPEITSLEKYVSYSRYTPTASHKKLLAESKHGYVFENADSNFIDLDWLFSSGNSNKEENIERFTYPERVIKCLSTDDATMSRNSVQRPILPVNGCDIKGKQVMETQCSHDANQATDILRGHSDSFVDWVSHGEILS